MHTGWKKNENINSSAVKQAIHCFLFCLKRLLVCCLYKHCYYCCFLFRSNFAFVLLFSPILYDFLLFCMCFFLFSLVFIITIYMLLLTPFICYLLFLLFCCCWLLCVFMFYCFHAFFFCLRLFDEFAIFNEFVYCGILSLCLLQNSYAIYILSLFIRSFHSANEGTKKSQHSHRD